MNSLWTNVWVNKWSSSLYPKDQWTQIIEDIKVRESRSPLASTHQSWLCSIQITQSKGADLNFFPTAYTIINWLATFIILTVETTQVCANLINYSEIHLQKIYLSKHGQNLQSLCIKPEVFQGVFESVFPWRNMAFKNTPFIHYQEQRFWYQWHILQWLPR